MPTGSKWQRSRCHLLPSWAEEIRDGVLLVPFGANRAPSWPKYAAPQKLAKEGRDTAQLRGLGSEGAPIGATLHAAADLPLCASVPCADPGAPIRAHPDEARCRAPAESPATLHGGWRCARGPRCCPRQLPWAQLRSPRRARPNDSCARACALRAPPPLPAMGEGDHDWRSHQEVVVQEKAVKSGPVFNTHAHTHIQTQAQRDTDTHAHTHTHTQTHSLAHKRTKGAVHRQPRPKPAAADTPARAHERARVPTRQQTTFRVNEWSRVLVMGHVFLS